MSDLPRLGLRPNPDAPLDYDLYLYDDGNAWTGWLRIALSGNSGFGVLTQDGQRDLIELGPIGGAL